MTTILIVDAPEGDASVLASALRVGGFRVVLASTIAEAREALAEGSIAITVLDLMIRTESGANGLEFARELRISHPDMRVMLTSSYYLSERQLERADCGVSGFIPKPYDVAEVVDFIEMKASCPPSSRRLWHAEHTQPESGVMPRVTVAPMLEAAGARGRR